MSRTQGEGGNTEPDDEYQLVVHEYLPVVDAFGLKVPSRKATVDIWSFDNDSLG
jgi:hypothetical protein